MTPEQRAATVYALVNLHNIDPDNLAAQLEADGVTIATITAERDAARGGEKTARNLMQKAFDVNRKVIAERDAAQAEIARLTAALATPDQIAALAAERAKLHKAVEAILNARAHHIHCVEAYNEKREFVEKLRVAGNWTHNPHVEYLAMCDAHREFVGIAERFADAVLAEIGGA